MKKRIILLFVSFAVLINFGYSQIDTVAVKIIKKSLKVISDYLKDKNSDTAMYRSRAIVFLSQLTGIPSESPGTYIGQSSPTQKDYNRWIEWLHIYENSLIYDNKRKVIIVSKVVKVLDENIQDLRHLSPIDN